jgi:tetratricopeptide (TPR) repeat protein
MLARKNIFKIRFLLCLLLLVSTQSMLVKAGSITYERANQLYHNQAYAEANELYLQMIAENVVNGSVYYNAGNSFFKLNKTGSAIWCYKKALQWEPSNIAFKENLAIAQKKLGKSKLGKRSQNPLLWWQQLVNIWEERTWAWATFLLFCTSILLVVVKKKWQLPAFFIGLKKLSWFLFFTFLIGTIGNYLYHKLFTFGVVISNTVLYKNATEKSIDKPSKTEGLQVRILGAQVGGIVNKNKLQIQLPNGQEAWVEADAVKEL